MNVCIVGYGAIGPTHAEALSGIESVNIYGICDIDKERADKGASAYDCIAFYDFEECLKDDKIDSIHICTPHYLHFEMIEKSLLAGKKVVTEKPNTKKKEEFDILLEKYSDKPICPVFQNRTNLCVQTLKEIIESDSSIGKLKAARGILTWHRGADYYGKAAWRGTKAYEGGGVLINQAVHTLDLMIYLGGNIKSANAVMSNKSLQGVIEVEDTVDALLEFKNGATGLFYATNAYAKTIAPEVLLEFEHATFRYANKKLYRDGEFICVDDTSFSGKDYWGSGHARLFYDFYVKKQAFTLSDVENTMQTVFAMYESAENGEDKKIEG